MSASSCSRNEPVARPWPAGVSLLLLLFLALTAGCATQRGSALPDMPDWETRTAVLAGVETWEFSGRIGVASGDDGFNGKLWWWQKDDWFRARVSGPLGVGTLLIDGDRSGVSVTDKDGAVTRLRDPEVDLRDRYGWTIPVASLRFWALGIPDPALPAQTEFGDDGQLTRLVQRDWTVSIAQYAEGGGQSMPRRVTATKDAARVRLVIDDWVFR